jgi:glycerol-3-phosphate dehydrogenase
VHDRVGGSTFDVRARFTVNATGPWLDATIAPLRPDARPLLRRTKGTHLVVPRATAQAHVLFAKRDGRLFFVLPWNGYTMVGTTDTDYEGDPAAAEASSEDVEYLRTEASRAFPRAPFDRVHFTWAGVRALAHEEGVAEGEVSRKHRLYDHRRRDGIDGVLSVIGGKITAYRSIAEEVTDVVARRLGSSARCRTSELPLPGAARPATVTSAVALCPHASTTREEIVRVVRAEWAVTLGDVLLRRTALGLAACQGLDRIEAIADLVGELLGWDPPRRVAEIAAYRREIAPMRRFSTG